MSLIPAVVLGSTPYGQKNGPYDGASTSFSSAAYKGDGYYGYSDGLHTVVYTLTNFVGIIRFQASLVTQPTESDWVDISSTTVGDGATPQSGTTYFNFTGNWVWVRCHVTSFTSGTINKVLYNN